MPYFIFTTHCKLRVSELYVSGISPCLLPSLCHGYFCRSLFCLSLTPFFYTEIICYLSFPGNHATPLLIFWGFFFSCLHVGPKTWMHHRFMEKTIIFCTLVPSYLILFSFLNAFLIAPEYWADNVTELTTVTPRCLSQVARAAWRVHLHVIFHTYFGLSFPLCSMEGYLSFLCVLSLPILLSHFKNIHASTKAYSKIWLVFSKC